MVRNMLQPITWRITSPPPTYHGNTTSHHNTTTRRKGRRLLHTKNSVWASHWLVGYLVNLVKFRMTHVEILNGDNFNQMLRDGFTDDMTVSLELAVYPPRYHISQCHHESVKRGLRGSQNMCSCLARAQIVK